MIYDPDKITFQETHKLMIGSIVPRPIAFVGTTSLTGTSTLTDRLLSPSTILPLKVAW